MTTVATLKQAQKLARYLLQQRLAACVNILPSIESHYHWQGKIDSGREALLFIKTRKNLYPKLQKEIIAQHPYSVPELIAVPISKGSPAYLKWLGQETGLRS